jgi:outer membrane protein assembly factor BamB
MKSPLPLLVSSLVATFFSSGNIGAETNWPEFRGPSAQGHSAAHGLPTEWSAEKNIVWRTDLPGRSWSSPVVAAGRIILTNAIPLVEGDESKGVSLHVFAVDAATGKQAWDSNIFQVTDEAALRMHKKNSQASPSVICEAGRIYAHFSHHGTACVDVTGKILWTTREHSLKSKHGTGGSPVIVDDLLIFDNDSDETPGVVALDKQTGKTRWRVTRPPTEAKSKFSFCTPLVIEVKGQKQVISPGSGIVQALNPKDGSEIWHVLYASGYSVVPRPVYAHGMIFLSSGYDKPVGYAIKADGQGDVTATHVAWTATKHVPLNPSMLVIGDELYMLDDGGFLSCLDARSGDVHYQERLVGPSSASLLFADGHIYAIDELGKTAVVAPGKTMQVLATSELGEKTQSSMAVCDNDLIIRTEKALYRVGKKQG